MRITPVQVVAPPYWLANLKSVFEYLDHRIQRGRRHHIGESSLDFPLWVIEYPQSGAATRLLIIGGAHGHEPGTVASVMNLIHLMETGKDLTGSTHPELTALLGRVHLYVMPMLNPDGRSVCPDSFLGLSTNSCELYACGLQKDGRLIPYDAGSEKPLYYFDPKDALFVGGQFNGAGIAINRRSTIDPVDAVEVDALLKFVMSLKLDAILDLHACGYNFAFQARSHPAPYWGVMREWQRRAEKLFAERKSPLLRLAGDGNPPTPPTFYFNSIVFHRRARLMWMAFEGRQGYLGNPSFMPQPTHEMIIHDYLTAVRVFVDLGVDGWYARANAETFGLGRPA